MSKEKKRNNMDGTPACLLRCVIYLDAGLVRLETTNPASTIPAMTLPQKNAALMKVVGVLF